MVDNNLLIFSRGKKGLSIRQLSKVSGVGASTISKIENKKSTGSLLVASKLAKALDLEIDKLFILEEKGEER